MRSKRASITGTRSRLTRKQKLEPAAGRCNPQQMQRTHKGTLVHADKGAACSHRVRDDGDLVVHVLAGLLTWRQAEAHVHVGDGDNTSKLHVLVVLVLLAGVFARHVHREHSSMRIVHYVKDLLGTAMVVLSEVSERIDAIAFVRLVLEFDVLRVQRQNCADQTHQNIRRMHAQYTHMDTGAHAHARYKTAPCSGCDPMLLSGQNRRNLPVK